MINRFSWAQHQRDFRRSFQVVFCAISVCAVHPFSIGAPPPKLGKPAGKTAKQQVDELVTRMHTATSPQSALLMLQELQSSVELDDNLQSRLATQRLKYEDLASRESMKLGGAWVSPEELREAVAEYHREISRGLSLVSSRDGKGALAAFESATRAYPEGIRARFLLGMAYSAKGNFNPEKASKYFESVLERSPSYFPAMNNLALSRFRVGKHGEAYVLWRRLLVEAPEFPEAVHNVLRIAQEIEAGHIRFVSSSKGRSKPQSRAENFVDLAATLQPRARSGQALFRPGTGWLYSPPIATAAERQESPAEVEETSPADVITGTSGTGVFVQKNLIVTSRSVAFDDLLGRALRVKIDQANGKSMHSQTGRILAVSDQEDLAAIEVDTEGAALTIADEISPGEQLQVLSAMPRFSLDAKLESVTGRILPFAVRTNHALANFSAEGAFNPGSALVDAEGRLLAITTSRYLGQLGANQSTAIPSSRIQQWLASINRSLGSTDPTVAGAGRPASGVVRLTGQFAAENLGLREALPEDLRGERPEFEDPACVHCNGGGTIRCTAAGCAFGAVTSFDVVDNVLDTPNNGRFVTKGTAVRRDRCENCDATGRLRCPICNGKGINPDIR